MSKESIIEELEYLEADAYSRGLAAGRAETLEAKISTMQFTQGDVLVFIGADMPRSILEKFRVQLKSLGVAGIISVENEVDIKKLSDVNLNLLGLRRDRL